MTSIIGHLFGRWAVLQGPIKNKATCQCSCGTVKVVRMDHLRSGLSRSCGCLKLEILRKRSTTHGNTISRNPTRTYRIWVNILTRCLNSNSRNFLNWGGRGIKVCDRWKSYDNFLSDMGEAPCEKSIDRINNNGDYELSNCRWATSKEQARNTRRNRLIQFDGKKLPMVEWIEITGLTRSQIEGRLKRGWSVEKTLGSP